MILLKRGMFLIKADNRKDLFLIFLPFIVVALSLIIVELFSWEKRIDNGIHESLQADREEIRQFSANPLFELYFDNIYYNLEPEIKLSEKRIRHLIGQKNEIAERYGRPDLYIAILSREGNILIGSEDDPAGFNPDIDASMLPGDRNSIYSEVNGNTHKTIAPIMRDGNISGYVVIWNYIPGEEVARQELKLAIRNLSIILLCLVVLQVVIHFFFRREKRRSGIIIREQQEYYKAIVEGHQGYIYIIDSEQKVEFMNGKLAGFVGAGKVGKKCYNAVFGLETPCPWCGLGYPDENGIINYEFQNPADSVWYFIVMSPITHTDGSVSTQIIMQDISVRKEAESRARKANLYIKNIIDSMPSVIIGVDRDTNITQWNEEAYKQTGISQDKALGKTLADCYPRLKSDVERICTAIDKKERQEDTGRQILRDGKVCYEDVTIYPIISGSSEGAVIRLDDVTSRKQVEELMIQSEKMLSVGGLAAGMAHEINNPLAGIMQSSDVIARRLGTGSRLPANLKAAEKAGLTMESLQTYMEERKIFRMLNDIHESGGRISTIINNMLNYSRKSEHIKSTHNITELLDYTLELARTDYTLKKEYNFKTIKIIKEYEENLPLLVCEGPEIQQVVFNILKNGAQAMQEAQTPDPSFTLRLMRDREENYICIEIQDNGPGIDDEAKTRIFDPFYTSKPAGVGTGLGLSVSFFIITEKHSGHLSVHSHPGEGALFLIKLPFIPPEV